MSKIDVLNLTDPVHCYHAYNDKHGTSRTSYRLVINVLTISGYHLYLFNLYFFGSAFFDLYLCDLHIVDYHGKPRRTRYKIHMLTLIDGKQYYNYAYISQHGMRQQELDLNIY